MVIEKRDGRKVPFDKQKIVTAISRAMEQVGEVDLLLANTVASEIEGGLNDYTRLFGESPLMNVEHIQHAVVYNLMKYAPKVAEAYIEYRYLHKLARDNYTELMDAVEDKLTARNVQNQNANVDERSFGGRVGETASLVVRQYALDHLLSPMARENHLGNMIYEHDLDAYAVGSHNCLSVPFDKLLANGFTTKQTDVRPAQSVNTAFQLVAVIFQIQSLQQFGGVSATHLDWTMVPYVRKSFLKHFRDGLRYVENKSEYKCKRLDQYLKSKNGEPLLYLDDKEMSEAHPDAWKYAFDMTVKEVYQAAEGLYHNLNTLQSRSGNQLPFTSVNFGTCTLQEGRLITRALLDTCIKGIGKWGRTSYYPCPIFQYMKGVNNKPGTPNYDLYRRALKSTAKRLYPNYANVDWSGNAGYNRNDPKTYFSTMGCRTANGWDINGMGQTKDGRGNICPVTIILPELAMMTKEEVGKSCIPLDATKQYKEEHLFGEFMELLDTKIHEAKDMLIERFDWICSQSPDSAKFMYENGTMEGYIPEEGIRSALKHGTLAIGQLGLSEALRILFGYDHTTEKGMKYAKKIEQLFKDRCAEFKEQYKLNFGVYYTPAENLCFTAMKKFKDKWGDVPGITDHDFFTNSIHVPVWVKMDPFKKIDIESQLTGYSSAGCITYVELDGDVRNNIDAMEELVNYAMEKDIPYFAINVPSDLCEDCGYCGEINGACPSCGGSNIKRTRRVTGYLGDPDSTFNPGKVEEEKSRVKHTGVECITPTP